MTIPRVPEDDAPPRASYPMWVRLGLWGLSSRASVLAFVWVSLACAVAGAIYARWDARGWYGLAFLLSALMYWLTIRWVDRHGRWD